MSARANAGTSRAPTAAPAGTATTPTASATPQPSRAPSSAPRSTTRPPRTSATSSATVYLVDIDDPTVTITAQPPTAWTNNPSGTISANTTDAGARRRIDRPDRGRHRHEQRLPSPAGPCPGAMARWRAAWMSQASIRPRAITASPSLPTMPPTRHPSVRFADVTRPARNSMFSSSESTVTGPRSSPTVYIQASV